MKRNTQGLCDSTYPVDSDVPLATFHRADIGAVQRRLFGEPLLAEPELLAPKAHVRCQDLAGARTGQDSCRLPAH